MMLKAPQACLKLNTAARRHREYRDVYGLSQKSPRRGVVVVQNIVSAFGGDKGEG